MEENKTAVKERRKLEVFHDPETNLYHIMFEGGGRTPKVLENQHFTTKQIAQKAIETYLNATSKN